MKAAHLAAFLGVALLVATYFVAELAPSHLPTSVLGVLVGIGSSGLAYGLWAERPVGEHRLVSLGSAFCLYYAISYGFAVLGTPPPFSARMFPEGLDGVDLSIVPLGILGWLVGYRLVRLAGLAQGTRRLILPVRMRNPVRPATLLAIYATTVLARILLVGSGQGYGYLRDVGEATTSANSLAGYATMYGNFGVIILGLAVVASANSECRQRGYRDVYLLIIPIELFLRAFAGTKESPLFFALMVILTLVAIGKLSLSPGKLAAIVFVSLLVVFPLIGTYRDLLRPVPGQQAQATEAPAVFVTAVGKTASALVSNPGRYTSDALDQITGRFRATDKAAVVVQAHEHGKAHVPAQDLALRTVTMLVPRVLWPEKPLQTYGLEMSREYYGLSGNVTSASSLSLVGDAYHYGGSAMVLVGLALVGGMVRFMDDVLAGRHSVWLVPLLVAAIPLFNGGDVAGFFVSVVRYYVIVGVLYRLLFLRNSPASLRLATRRRLDRREVPSDGRT